MAQQRKMLDRVLADASNEETLKEANPLLEAVRRYVAFGFAKEYKQFSVRVLSAIARSATRNRPPKYPLVLPINDPLRFPKQEIQRIVSIGGEYGPGMSVSKKVIAGDSSRPQPLGRSMFAATLTFYYHSEKWKWELGRIWMRFIESTVSPGTEVDHITRNFINKPYLRSGERYKDHLLSEQTPF